MWATDPTNGLTVPGTDFIYSVFLYDTTGIAGGDPGVDPQFYHIFRWAPPYDISTAKYQTPSNVPPNGSGVGYVDYSKPYDNRLAVDDQVGPTRCYILDSNNDIEVVDCDFSQDEFSGWSSVGTVTQANKPADVKDVLDMETIQTTSLGAPRNYVATLVTTTSGQWRIWVFDYLDTNPIDTQAVTTWLSDPFDGVPQSLDAADGPIELHVLHKNGGMMYVSVFRDYP
jgi:hypothetical protein